MAPLRAVDDASARVVRRRIPQCAVSDKGRRTTEDDVSTTPNSESESQSSDEDEKENAPWHRTRTPSPEMSYFSLTGRPMPPPPCVLLVPMVAAVPPSAWQAAAAPCRQRLLSWADAVDDEELSTQCSLSSQCSQSSVSNATVPSVGSTGRDSGTCRPCAHSWRPDGCSKGAACTYCHLCGQAELLVYKRQYRMMRALARKAGAEAESAEPRAEREAANLCVPCAAAETACCPPSVGSVAHASGACRPCAHHWRAAGCAKGAACSFCHVCGEGDFHAFRALCKEEKERRVRGGAAA